MTRSAVRVRAHARLHAALRRGDIVKPLACEACGQVVEPFLLRAHHADHLLPLDVEWLCTTCHGGRSAEGYLASMFEPSEWSGIVAKAKREGVDLQVLVCDLLREWAS